jgi:uncharacterized protein (DUF1499 family)
MAPVEMSAPAQDVLDAVQAVLDESPAARITGRSGNQIDSVFTTRVFRFKDDVSFAFEDGKLHFRSASRVGHSDLGANRKRMTALIPKIKAKL